MEKVFTSAAGRAAADSSRSKANRVIESVIPRDEGAVVRCRINCMSSRRGIRASFAPIACAALLALGAMALRSQRAVAAVDGPLADAFATGWMLADTNGDGLADFINGKI